MKIQITTHAKPLCLAVKNFVVDMSEDLRHSRVELRFNNEADSFQAFNDLTKMGVRCYHAGKNAPEGASVMMYACDHNDFQIKTN